MSKERDMLGRLGGNLAESMGVNRIARAGQGPAGDDRPAWQVGTERLRSAVAIDLDRIVADPDQPREEFNPEALDRLARSIERHGQLQPIAVRWSEELSMYLIVAGERRWRASVKAGRPTIDAVILDGKTDSQILEIQLIENCLREDLSPIEQAKAFRRLMDRNGWSARQLGRELNLADATIVRASALLNLPDDVQRRVEAGELAPATAYEVSKLGGAEAQAGLAARVMAEGLSRDETVEIVKRAAASNKVRGAKGKTKGPKLPTSRGIRTAVGLKVTVEGRKGFETSTLLAALREAVAKVEAETEDDQLAA